LIGGLWANLSEGRCRFVMVKDKRWEWIEEKMQDPTVHES
jgi:type III restriction enzyme